jgi:hypothetical protein
MARSTGSSGDGYSVTSSGYDPAGNVGSHHVSTTAKRQRVYSALIYSSLAMMVLSFIYWILVVNWYGSKHITIDQGCAYLLINLTPAAVSVILVYNFFALRAHWRYHTFNCVVGAISAVLVAGAIYWYGIYAYTVILHH